jgi:hypothetical protein
MQITNDDSLRDYLVPRHNTPRHRSVAGVAFIIGATSLWHGYRGWEPSTPLFQSQPNLILHLRINNYILINSTTFLDAHMSSKNLELIEI